MRLPEHLHSDAAGHPRRRGLPGVQAIGLLTSRTRVIEHETEGAHRRVRDGERSAQVRPPGDPDGPLRGGDVPYGFVTRGWLPRSMPKKRYHHGNLREALVRTATTLIDNDGVEAFTLTAASRAVGVTHAAAYKHFADRTALLREVSGAVMVTFGDSLQTAFDAHTEAQQQYLATGRAVVSFASRHPHLYTLAFGSIRSDDLATLSAPPEGSALGRFVAMIGSWQRQGWLKPGDPTHWAMVLWASAHGLAMLVASGRIDVSDAAALQMSDALLRSIHDGIG